MGNPLSWLTEWVTSVVETLGYAGVAGLIFLENLFPPIPSEVILPLAGFLAGRGRFWLPGVVVAATAGSVLGALVLYALGARLGEERVRAFADANGRWLRVDGEDLDKARGWFDRHGGRSVLVGRLVPVVRSLVSIPAGINRMPLGRFVLFTALGSGLWNAVLIGLGWVLGDRWTLVERYAQVFGWVALAALVAAGAWWVWRRRRERG